MIANEVMLLRLTNGLSSWMSDMITNKLSMADSSISSMCSRCCGRRSGQNGSWIPMAVNAKSRCSAWGNPIDCVLNDLKSQANNVKLLQGLAEQIWTLSHILNARYNLLLISG